MMFRYLIRSCFVLFLLFSSSVSSVIIFYDSDTNKSGLDNVVSGQDGLQVVKKSMQNLIKKGKEDGVGAAYKLKLCPVLYALSSPAVYLHNHDEKGLGSSAICCLQCKDLECNKSKYMLVFKSTAKKNNHEIKNEYNLFSCAAVGWRHVVGHCMAESDKSFVGQVISDDVFKRNFAQGTASGLTDYIESTENEDYRARLLAHYVYLTKKIEGVCHGDKDTFILDLGCYYEGLKKLSSGLVKSNSSCSLSFMGVGAVGVSESEYQKEGCGSLSCYNADVIGDSEACVSIRKKIDEAAGCASKIAFAINTQAQHKWGSAGFLHQLHYLKGKGFEHVFIMSETTLLLHDEAIRGSGWQICDRYLYKSDNVYQKQNVCQKDGGKDIKCSGSDQCLKEARGKGCTGCGLVLIETEARWPVIFSLFHLKPVDTNEINKFIIGRSLGRNIQGTLLDLSYVLDVQKTLKEIVLGSDDSKKKKRKCDFSQSTVLDLSMACMDGDAVNNCLTELFQMLPGLECIIVAGCEPWLSALQDSVKMREKTIKILMRSDFVYSKEKNAQKPALAPLPFVLWDKIMHSDFKKDQLLYSLELQQPGIKPDLLKSLPD